MAALHVTTRSILAAVFPMLSPPAVQTTTRSATLFTRQVTLPLFPTLSLSLPSAISLNIPTLLGDIWDGLLKAVPKKKTSHMKKRSRFMAGKALKDVTALNRCSACGHLKRAHTLCPYCVTEIRNLWNGNIDRANAKEVAEKSTTKVDKPTDTP